MLTLTSFRPFKARGGEGRGEEGKGREGGGAKQQSAFRVRLSAVEMASSVPVVERVKLGSQGFEVSKQGLGCMSMSAFYGAPKPEPEMIELIRHAVDIGVTFFDTSDAYGPHTNEVLLGKVRLDCCVCWRSRVAVNFSNAG